MDLIERQYWLATGHCLEAIQGLRRFAGRDAIQSLRSAIRIIEQEQQRQDRSHSINRGTDLGCRAEGEP